MWAIICVLAVVSLFAASSYASTPEILILFDQSRSMRNYNTKQLSMLWMSTVVRSFEIPHRITLVGFDYESYEHLSVVISEEAELSSLSELLDRIELIGKATDIEVPFRYAFEKGAADSLKMVLIITDGEPDIWAENTGFISPRVLTDARYEDLNDRYRFLTASGLSKPELYNRLGTKFRKRNLELIEEVLSLLYGEVGKKLVIWDISGTSELLKRWASLSDAIYMPLVISTSEPLLDPLQGLLKATLDTTKTMLEEPVEESEINKDQTQKGQFSEWFGSFAGVLVVFVAAIFITGLLFYRKHRYSSKPESKSNESAFGSVKEVGTDREPGSLDNRHVTDTSVDKEEISEYIDKRLKTALEITEKYVSELFSEVTAGIGSDKRLSFRVQTPPGSLVVFWTDRDGKHRSANAINISMHGILFETSHCDADSIDRIEAPNIGMRIGVTRSLIKHRDINKFIIVLVEFERGAEDKIVWIELQTRIKGEN